MTDQELFDKVKAHLLKQNARSTDAYSGGTTCAYRGAEGRKCAIGCLIPDEDYSMILEGKGPYVPAVRIAAGLSLDQGALAADLQGVHDGWEPSMWPECLVNVAKNHGLEA